MAHEVPLERRWRGRRKLAKMAALAIEECLEGLAREHWSRIPLLLCVAESERPGRLEGLDDELFGEIQAELAAQFAAESAIVPRGRASVGIALRQARQILAEGSMPYVLIVATDSLLSGTTIDALVEGDRLLTPTNSNGFMPGEASGALLVGRAGGVPQLICSGIGFAMEPAPFDSEQPLRGDGLTEAIKEALTDAECAMHDLDFRVCDLSGEQYYFKEAALALTRVLRSPKEEFDVWHPAECIGETGAAAGIATIALVEAACRKQYARGPNVLVHASNDSGQRVATILQFRA
jgi:3-oxoacyl-[acyl-carrier-protein] synthase-1